MWTFISVSLALVISFYNPEITENKNETKNNFSQNKTITGFPYQYFKGEVLTNETVKFRIQRRYIYFMISITVIFSVGPTVGPIVRQAVFTSTATSRERIIPNQLDFETNQQKLLLDVKGGGDDLLKFLFKFLYIWTWVASKNQKPTEAFQIKPPNQHFLGPNHVQPNPRIAVKLQENPVNRNNPGQGTSKSSKLNKHPSMDELANSLNPEYAEYQSKYYSDSLPKRFDTKDYSVDEFEQLAKDPRTDTYTRVSIDEGRAALQAERENIIIEPTRPDKSVAKNVDLDYEVSGPAPFTHVDIKTPVGSEILRKQNQSITLEKMSYNLGQKAVDQRHRFVGKKNGPASAENVGHLIDLCYVPANEKAIVKGNILRGAQDNGGDAGIIFLNDK